MVLIPVLFFVLLEMVLRVFNYGDGFAQWTSYGNGTLKLNPDIARKYFYSIRNIPHPDGDTFDEIKMPDSFRIFVLGESAAAGYPFLPNGAFSRYLQQRLSLAFPASKIEVVNCAMTAINSFAMRDMMPGILKEKPDLIVIYAGNNEYYGSLGVGSMESFGTSRAMVDMVLYLERFRTFQLLRNLMRDIGGIFLKQQEPSGTLMSRIARDQYIGLGSKIYNEGIEQFEGNMGDILEMASERHVPVILGTLACNLKDQYPFISIAEHGFPRADSVFRQANRALAGKDLDAADSLFRYAKDLDALRFRAPSELNDVIESLGIKFHDPVIKIDSAFDAMSPDHVVGDNLMSDHLHPTLYGYRLIGKLYYDEMEQKGLLPKSRPLGINDGEQDSLTIAKFAFCPLDSVIGDFRIKLLKNDWPFVEKDDEASKYTLLGAKNYIDSLAYEVIEERNDWATAHREAARWYAERSDLTSFVRVMNVLIAQYPSTVENYDYAADVLMKSKQFDAAYDYLKKRNGIAHSAYSDKWLGAIDLNEKRISSAKDYLCESIKYDNSDPQVWYNLAGVYIAEKDFQDALQSINMALSLLPNYSSAIALKEQLIKAVK